MGCHASNAMLENIAKHDTMPFRNVKVKFEQKKFIVPEGSAKLHNIILFRQSFQSGPMCQEHNALDQVRKIAVCCHHQR